MPNLKSIKVNNSIMTSLRDIGSSLKMIEALSASFSTIKDLSGILSFPVLKELYLPYNQISDV